MEGGGVRKVIIRQLKTGLKKVIDNRIRRIITWKPRFRKVNRNGNPVLERLNGNGNPVVERFNGNGNPVLGRLNGNGNPVVGMLAGNRN